MFEGKRRRLLLVDDQEPVRIALARAFERAGWSVKACGDGETAIEALERDSFDAALVDNNLPGVRGDEVVRRIRLPGDGTPVVRISNTPADPAADLAALGIAAYLVKPLDPRRVLAIVNDIVERKNAAAAPAAEPARADGPPPAASEPKGVVGRLKLAPAAAPTGPLFVAFYLERRKSLSEAEFLAAHPEPVLVLEPAEDLEPSPLPAGDRSPRAEVARSRHDTMPRSLTDELHKRVRLVAERSEVIAISKRATNLYDQKITIGRAANNDIVMRHPSVSPFHAYFRRIDERTLALVEGGSAAGTCVDWKPLPPLHSAVLAEGTEITFGEVRCRFHDAAGFWAYLGTFLLPGMQ